MACVAGVSVAVPRLSVPGPWRVISTAYVSLSRPVRRRDAHEREHFPHPQPSRTRVIGPRQHSPPSGRHLRHPLASPVFAAAARMTRPSSASSSPTVNFAVAFGARHRRHRRDRRAGRDGQSIRASIGRPSRIAFAPKGTRRCPPGRTRGYIRATRRRPFAWRLTTRRRPSRRAAARASRPPRASPPPTWRATRARDTSSVPSANLGQPRGFPAVRREARRRRLARTRASSPGRQRRAVRLHEPPRVARDGGERGGGCGIATPGGSGIFSAYSVVSGSNSGTNVPTEATSDTSRATDAGVVAAILAAADCAAPIVAGASPFTPRHTFAPPRTPRTSCRDSIPRG